MAKISSFKPRIDKWNRGAKGRCSNVLNSRLMIENSVNLVEFERMCWKRYGNKSWYDKKLEKGWPGVKGIVRFGRPVINRFNEIIVVTLSEQNVPKCTVLGRA